MAAQVIAVSQAGDVGTARQAARALAAEVGFDATAGEELAIVASELASNLVKHTPGGWLTLTPVAADGRAGLRIESRDSGPGIADVDQALTDSFSTTGSLGYGLGTVNRLMDSLEITSPPGLGARIVCQRWLRPLAPGPTPGWLDFGVATRALPGETVNGDSFVTKQWQRGALGGVIDGLGHGPNAHRAAEAARQYVENHYDQPLAAIFRGVALACRATRGVVMALARFDNLATSGTEPQVPVRLSFASIGNIEARVCDSPAPANFIVRRGVLGGLAPGAAVTEHPWDPRAVLVLHSDGLSTHWRWEDFSEVAREPAANIAQQLLRKLAKAEDDATVLVVKARTGPAGAWHE